MTETAMNSAPIQNHSLAPLPPSHRLEYHGIKRPTTAIMNTDVATDAECSQRCRNGDWRPTSNNARKRMKLPAPRATAGHQAGTAAMVPGGGRSQTSCSRAQPAATGRNAASSPANIKIARHLETEYFGFRKSASNGSEARKTETVPAIADTPRTPGTSIILSHNKSVNLDHRAHHPKAIAIGIVESDASETIAGLRCCLPSLQWRCRRTLDHPLLIPSQNRTETSGIDAKNVRTAIRERPSLPFPAPT